MYQQVDIDFEVFKELTALRESESITYNDVIRRLLHLEKVTPGGAPDAESADSGPWRQKGVEFPLGTEFRARYKGNTIPGRVTASGLMVDGKLYDSPSAAAVAVTQSAVNGWRFWECRRPGDASWRKIDSLRK